MDMTDATWRTSSYSGSNGGECVEVAAHHEDTVRVRDTKNRDGGMLRFSSAAWRRYIGQVKEDA
jgi:hypothetical protein